MSKEEIEKLASEKILSEQGQVGFTLGYNECLKDNADKKYTDEDLRKAIELARETESERRGALSEDWDDVEKYDVCEIIELINEKK